MPRYSAKQKVALDALMRDEAYRHAVEIIESDGLHGLTLERLAKRIGVSRGSLYNYFTDRDAIVDLVEERTFEPMIAVLETIAGGDKSAAAKLEAITRTILAAVRENRTVVAALSPEKYSGRDKQSHIRRRQRGLDLLRRVLQEGIDDGEFRKLSAGLVAEVLYGTITGLIDDMAHRGEFRTPKAIVPTLMQVFLQGLKRGR
jgi:AcrR family transcriptional regulator